MKKGFALLELLVVVSFFALIGSAVYVFVIAPPKTTTSISERPSREERTLPLEPVVPPPPTTSPPTVLPPAQPKPPPMSPPQSAEPSPPPTQPPPSAPSPSLPLPPSDSNAGVYSGFFGFPEKFFTDSVVPKEQMVKVADTQYQSLKKMHNGNAPYSFARIEYDPPVYGTTLPNGIKLGDAAFPGLNTGHPRWEVMAHEQGHNFFGGTSVWYNTLGVPGPFLQESLAVLSAFYTYHNILEDKQVFGIDEKTIESLNYDFTNGRNYQKSQYELYLSQGKKFDDQNTLTSQALDYKMIEYGEKHGWQNYTKLAKAFENGIASQFIFQQDGVSAVERSTYIIAALGIAFNKDFRGDFQLLSFPIDDTLYNEIYSKIIEYTK